jgi:hypothetical protein
VKGKYTRDGKTRKKIKQILEDIKETRRYYKSKYESLARAVWRIDSGRGYGPAVDQTTA